MLGQSKIIFLLVFCTEIIYSQVTYADSVITFPDTSQADSSVAAKALQDTADGGLDTLIFYGADTTEGTLDNSTVILKNNAWVKYRGMEIRAARITMIQPQRLMIAEAVPDSVDSLGAAVTYKGIPEFSENGESFRGNKMEYNFDTRRGRVIMGETKLQDGLYYGQNIRKIGDNTLYVKNGRFTTCEGHDPHFYFQTREMKMIVKDKVVAKPIILHIHEVPIFAIPFGVFPNRSGRASGITPPSYNETPREGKQVRNFGYYWAPNDYFDALLQVDFLDKAGFLVHGGARYAKRYEYTGSFQFSRSSLSYITGEKTNLWSVDVTHNHTLSERSNLNADIHYVSSKNFYQFTSINPDQILNRQIRTNVSYNTTFDWGSLSANLSQSKNLDNGQREFTFPNVSITKSSAAIFPKSENDKNKPDQWYQTIRYSYSSNALRRETQANDSAAVLSAVGMNHTAGLSAPFKILRYFNLTPSVNFQETWFDRRSENFRYTADNRLVSDTVRGFFARHTFNASLSFSTKVYGVMNPHLFGLETFRHVMTPSVSLTYQPDFSSSQWGYYETARDTTGKKTKFDRYSGNILFGGTPQGRSLSLGANLGNVFQAKYLATPADSSKTNEPAEKKIDLLNWNSSISYNFEAPEFKLSLLSSSFTLSNDLAKRISLTLNLTHDFYRYDRTLNRRVNDLVKIPRLVNASLTSGFTLGGGDQSQSQAEPQENNLPAYNQRLPVASTLPVDVPWSARFDLNYDINKSNPNNVSKTFGMNMSGSVKISQNWQATYSARLDILKKDLVSQTFSFSRDLHCWEMRFDWTPNGPAAGYFFIVQIKSPTLRDIKLQRTDYGSRIFN